MRTIKTLVTYLNNNDIESAKKMITDISLQKLFFKACKDQNIQAVDFLLSQGASIYDCDANGNTPLLVSIEKVYDDKTSTDITVLKRLYEKFLEDAHNHPSMIPVFFDANHGLLYVAAQMNNLPAITYLIEKGFQINCKNVKNGQTPLHAAIVDLPFQSRQSFYAIQFLVEKNANIFIADNNDSQPIHCAIATSADRVFDYLIKKIIEQKTQPLPSIYPDLLHYAAYHYLPTKNPITHEKINNPIIQQLLSQGYSVEDRDEEGNTPLHIAASCKQIPTLEQFLAFNSSAITAINNNGETFLHCFLKNIDLTNSDDTLQGTVYAEFVLSLLKTHPKLDSDLINAMDHSGETILIIAANKGLISLVNGLIHDQRIVYFHKPDDIIAIAKINSRLISSVGSYQPPSPSPYHSMGNWYSQYQPSNNNNNNNNNTYTNTGEKKQKLQ